MRVLLDTQCWLWMEAFPERLSPQARTVVASPEHELYLSAASAWEIAIKYALGRLRLPVPPQEYVPTRLQRSGVQALPVHHTHALHVAGLPAHHSDPFDRLLIAQALLEGLTILTADRHFEAYGVPLVPA
jgi:PIN domain nuclease of toxin-antitoxin system